MPPRRLRRLVSPVLMLLLVAGAAVSAGQVDAAPSSSPGDTGCDPNALVVAHDGAGKVLRVPTPKRPLVCAVQTGYQTAETRIGVGNDGTVLQYPAVLPMEPAIHGFAQATSGFAVSPDRGRTWQVHQVRLPVANTGHTQWSSQDVNFFVDRATGRIFASAPSLEDPQPNLAYSADNGRTWITSRPTVGWSVENPNFVFAKPRNSLMSEYPNVVYYCENLTIFGTTGRVCSKSLDGGNSWITVEQQGFTGRNVVPAHAECGSDREEFSPGPEGYPVAHPDGSLYLIVSCGGKHFMARSTDEAATWPILTGSGGEPLTVTYLAGRPAPVLRADSAGNLYTISQMGGKLLLATSRDGGRTWSRERNLVPPGVPGIDKWYMQARDPGHVAVSFYSRREEGSALDAWLSETRNALAKTPTFLSARLNDPRTPLLWSRGGNAAWPLLDFIGVDIGPDGTVWGSFIQDCGPTPGESIACQGRTTYSNVGYVGRLRA